MTMTVEEAAETLGVSRWLGYEMAKTGELRTLRCGRRRLVPVRRLLELLGMSWDEWLSVVSLTSTEEVAERPRRLAIVGREEVAVDSSASWRRRDDRACR